MRWKAIDTNPPTLGTKCLFTDGKVVFIGSWNAQEEEFYIDSCASSAMLQAMDEVSYWISIDEILRLAKR